MVYRTRINLRGFRCKGGALKQWLSDSTDKIRKGTVAGPPDSTVRG